MQCYYALITDESQIIFQKYLNILKLNYEFYPKYINIDFSKYINIIYYLF